MTGEIVAPQIQKQKLFRFLSIGPDFMKLFCDRELSEAVDTQMTLAEQGFTYVITRGCLNYENQIDCQKLSTKYGYNKDRLSQNRVSLIKKGLIKKQGPNYYLSPLIAIKSKEISQDLINLFEDTFERYGVRADRTQ